MLPNGLALVAKRVSSVWHSPRTVALALQREPADCGITAVVALTALLGRQLCQRALKAHIGDVSRGLTAGNIRDVLRYAGFTADAIYLTPEFAIRTPKPFIAFWNENHFVVIGNRRGKYRNVFDPSYGWRLLSPADIRRSISCLGVIVTSVPQETLIPLHTPFPIFRWIRQFVAIPRLTRLVVLLLVSELVAIAFPWLTGKVVDGSGVQSVSAVENIVVYAGFTAFGAVVAFLTTSFRSNMSRSIYRSMMASAHKSVFEAPLPAISAQLPEALASRLSSLEGLFALIVDGSAMLLVQLLVGFGALIVMALLNPLIFALSFAISLFKLAVQPVLNRSLVAVSERYEMAHRDQRATQVDHIRSIGAIRRFKVTEQAFSAFSKRLTETATVNHEKNIVVRNRQFIQAAFGSIDRVMFMAIGASLLVAHKITAGDYLALGLYRELLVHGMESGREFIQNNAIAKVLGRQAEDFLDVSGTRKKGATIEPLDGSVVVQSLSFRYSRFGPYVLRNLSFEVQDGECVAIVAPSGVGKTTLAKILCGQLRSGWGSVRIGQREVMHQIDGAACTRLGVVLQDDCLIGGSIRDNIDMMRGFSNELVEAAANIAEIHEFIDSLPMGYGTPVNDSVVTISGGQRQRILLARALCGDVKLLILDESTSHLDVRTEAKIAQNIRKLKMTRILIAHRRETIETADRVIDLDELMELGGAAWSPEAIADVAVMAPVL
jgi:ATP-binding cassette, subfamily B, bacterial CvaB/MchF/RaxB